MLGAVGAGVATWRMLRAVSGRVDARVDALDITVERPPFRDLNMSYTTSLSVREKSQLPSLPIISTARRREA